jgi:hypothetical protein
MIPAPSLPVGIAVGHRSVRVVKPDTRFTVADVVFPVVLLLLGLFGTARVTRLISADKISEPVRAAAVRRWGPSSGAGYLLHCRWCVSMYVAPVFAAAVLWLAPELRGDWWAQTLTVGALLSLTYSHGTALLAGLEDDD